MVWPRRRGLASLRRSRLMRCSFLVLLDVSGGLYRPRTFFSPSYVKPPFVMPPHCYTPYWPRRRWASGEIYGWIDRKVGSLGGLCFDSLWSCVDIPPWYRMPNSSFGHVSMLITRASRDRFEVVKNTWILGLKGSPRWCGSRLTCHGMLRYGFICLIGVVPLSCRRKWPPS